MQVGPNIIQSVGGQAAKPLKFSPIYVNRWYGLYTHRNPLRDPSSTSQERFYGGLPGALIDGLNVELSSNLTLVRRPGTTAFTTATFPTKPLAIYEVDLADGAIDCLVDTTSDLYLVTPTSKTSILSKGAGSGQSFVAGVNTTIYIGDGVETKKYDGTNTWDLGIDAPTDAPTVITTPTGSGSALPWQASTVDSTMGLIVDANGNVQQLTSVNALGTNTTQYGETGSGEPTWNLTPPNTTTDNTISWQNMGPIVLWTAGTTYNNSSLGFGGTLANPCIIYDPVSQSCYVQANPGHATGVSGTVKPSFSGGFASVVHDNTVKWFCIGSPKIPGTWLPSHVYPSSVTNNISVSSISVPVSLANGLPSNQTVFWFLCGGGTSGTGGSAPPWNTAVGQQTKDNQNIWTCMGTATRATNHPYAAWVSGASTFDVIEDSNSNMQVCITGGTSSNTATASITWSTDYGQTTIDGTVTWVCVGSAMSWAASTTWYLPATGFFPPQSSVPYGGAAVIDSNGNVQFCTNSGKSGSSTPSWGTPGTTTTDGGVTWFCEGVASANSFSWKTGYGYAVAFKSRKATDLSNTVAPPGVLFPLGPPTGAADGSVSSISPIFQITTGNPGAFNTLSGVGSTNPAVDTIEFYRTFDGGTAPFFLADIPNPPAVGGIAQPYSYVDFQTDDVLDIEIPAPSFVDVTGAVFYTSNNPPPDGLINLEWHESRLWGSVGNTVYASGGPDVVTGNGYTAFFPFDTWSFQATVTRLLSTSVGLIVFTTNGTSIISGGPQITTFRAYDFEKDISMLSWNNLSTLGNLVYLWTLDRQFVRFDPSSGVDESGFAIGDSTHLGSFDPATTYVSTHIDGSDDKAIYISNGTDTIYRLNPNQSPDGGGVWSPKATITGGSGAIASVKTVAGANRLLIGGTGINLPILQRDLSVWSDNSTAYSAKATIGTWTLAHPGQLAVSRFLTCDFVRIGTSPVVSFCTNPAVGSIAATFTTFPSVVNDPPQLPASPTMFNNRYYFNLTQAPSLCRYMQVAIDYGNTDTVQNELLAVCLSVAFTEEV